MPLNIRKTKFDDADSYRMFVDAEDLNLIPADTLNNVLNSEEAMEKVADSELIMEIFANSSICMDTIANSSTAMDAVAASSVAMNAVAASSTAMNAIMNGTQIETWWGSSYYIGKGLATYANLSHADLDELSTVSDIAANSTAMNAIANSSTAIDAVVASSTAMNAVAASSTAMNAVAASSTAMNVVAASSTAMNVVVASSTAMDAVAASSTAMNAIMNGTQIETWWGSSYYIGKGLATYANLSHADLDELSTVSDIAANSTAMNVVAASSTAMNAVVASSTAIDAVVASSTAMDAVAASSTAMNVVVASSTAMNAVVASSTAMDAVAASSTAMNVVVASSTAMNAVAASNVAMTSIWNSDTARQACWASSTARLAIWNNISVLRNITINSTPNLVSETPLNTDTSAGYLTKAAKSYGTGDWTAVNINDGAKYIAFIHFHSFSNCDWYTGKIASYNQTTDLQTTDAGESLTRGNLNATSNGLWVWFHDNSTGWNSLSFARVWYIKV